MEAICTNDIVNQYGPLVSSLCHRMIQKEDDAKDAAQEVWLEIVKGLPKYRGESKLSTWIYTVTYHTVIRYCKNEKKYTTNFLSSYFRGEPLVVPYQYDYDKHIWIKEMCDKCLTGILHCLDEESRLAYLFRDMVELSYEEISDILEKEPATMRKIVSRCRKKLKNFLNKECILYNPKGKCNCRMKHLVTEIDLQKEYQKVRRFVRKANIYLESNKILPQKNFWINFIK